MCCAIFPGYPTSLSCYHDVDFSRYHVFPMTCSAGKSPSVYPMTCYAGMSFIFHIPLLQESTLPNKCLGVPIRNALGLLCAGKVFHFSLLVRTHWEVKSRRTHSWADPRVGWALSVTLPISPPFCVS